MAGPGVGDRAPDFSLAGTGGTTYRLWDHRGFPMVLAFYPGDDTPVCTNQLRSYNDELDQLTGLGATLWAISPQSVQSHEGFGAKLGLAFPLLADVDKATFKAYGCLGPLGFPRRSVFVVDGDGIIRYAHRALAGLTFKKTPELVEAVRSAS